MKKSLLVLMLSAAVPAGAVELGARVTNGNEGYSGMNAYGVIAFGDLTLRPAVDSVKNDYIGGETVRNYSARLGYDTNFFGIGAQVGATPKVDGYQNVSAGADIIFTLSATGGGSRRLRSSGGAPRGKGLARLDVGGGMTLTNHEDEKNSAGAALASPRKLAQRDISLFAAASLVGFNISANVTNSSYDKDLTGADRSALRLSVEGLNTRLAGYPETSMGARAEAPFLPLINPFISVNKTTYEKSTLESKTVGVGAYLGLEMLEVYGALERTDFNLSAVKDLTTYTLGAALRFGAGS